MYPKRYLAWQDFLQIALLVLSLVVFGEAVTMTTSATPRCIYNDIPEDLSQECTTLTIQGGNLGVLSKASFISLNESMNVRKLVISDNQITEIERNALQNFPFLEHLDASGNLIGNLDQAVFESLPELSILYLQGNRISNISNSAFQGLDNLKVLRLDDNRLENIGTFFVDVPSLDVLNLTLNRIAEISSNAFDGMTKLHYLYLGYNRLMEMPEAFTEDRLKKLHVLNMRSNLIKVSFNSSYLHYDYLEELYLTNNDIPELSDDVFKYLRRLQVLHLDYNRLTNFNAWLVHHPQGLQEIKLDNNPWDCICNNTEVWSLLKNQRNLTIIEQESTFCATPSTRRREVTFDFMETCESKPVLSTTAVNIIIISSAILVTFSLMSVCMFYIRRKCHQKKKMRVNPVSPQTSMTTTDSQVELPNHEYLCHAISPKPLSPSITNGPTKPINLVAGDGSTLRSHIYDKPEFKEALCRDPSLYINNKIVKMNLQRCRIDQTRSKDVEEDLDSDTDYYLVPIELTPDKMK
ncbi:leucine-rich repeat transmembrane neuronal protein 4-like [Lytechinus variegatus]|uniref:leucine-rich repeat transmembrane neuronal protein 4-like n=1 Tax=Lytechinus variegatus TaxID=7654 RepID=UPI001BB2B6B5|nr:leucine-rich repeat transmembrane neuronal protein 4-like [Lytechinus variegatus]